VRILFGSAVSSTFRNLDLPQAPIANGDIEREVRGGGPLRYGFEIVRQGVGIASHGIFAAGKRASIESLVGVLEGQTVERLEADVVRRVRTIETGCI